MSKLIYKRVLRNISNSPVGLGLGVTSLGLSIAGYRNSNKNISLQKGKARVEEESLTELKKIHEALKGNNVKTDRN